MLGSTLLDVMIGVVFIYLFLSLIIATFTEMLANMLKMRAANMEQWVNKVLEDPALAEKFYSHPLIKGITQDGRKPSYIPTRTFALALMDIIAPIDPKIGSRNIGALRDEVSKLPDSLQRTMLVHIDAAQHDLEVVRQNIEKWFDDSMERVAGWYKRKSQYIVLGLSFVLAIGLNVDTISLTKGLYNDSSLRAALVASAEVIVKEPLKEGEKAKVQLDRIEARLNEMKFPLGWHVKQTYNWIDGMHEYLEAIEMVNFMNVIGWIITAFAVSLGAPFWFDTLGKIINIRNAGVKPKKTDEVAAKE
jgi:hypothetical protein